MLSKFKNVSLHCTSYNYTVYYDIIDGPYLQHDWSTNARNSDLTAENCLSEADSGIRVNVETISLKDTTLFHLEVEVHKMNIDSIKGIVSPYKLHLLLF